MLQHRKDARDLDRNFMAFAQLRLAQVAINQRRAKDAVKMLGPLYEKRGNLDGILQVRISTAYAEALEQQGAKGGDADRVRQLLLNALGQAERSATKPESARIYSLLAMNARAKGDSDQAASYSKEALKTLDAMKAEPGGDKVLGRADFGAIYRECSQSAGAKG
jgi:hypothetical protein